MKPHILIDGVFFQIGRSGIARVWSKVWMQWLRDGFADHVTLIDRGGTLVRPPGFRVIDAPRYNPLQQEADHQLLQIGRAHV